ncbi:MAG: GNAT family N-acyltransferase [Pseudomonadota bacterium]
MKTKPHSALALPRRRGLGWAATAVEQVSGLALLERLYGERPDAQSPADFIRFALQKLQIEPSLVAGSLESLPQQGPVIVICNHPFGAADGLVLADLLLRRRPDLLIFANELLRRIPEIAPLIAPVDVFRPGASLAGVRAALRHLQQGGMLVVFPAGEVSRLDWRDRRVADRPWAESVALLARRSGADLLPMHIEGQARWSSLLAGAVHPRLRTTCLPQDLLHQREHAVRVHLGETVTARELSRIAPTAQTAYLRLLSDSLGLRMGSTRIEPFAGMPIAAEQPVAVLAAEVAALPANCLLCQQDAFAVYLADAGQMPALLLEIGRLRELSFRQVQEGSGQACDIDGFDAHYKHLFVWHREQQQIIGAYRLGFTESAPSVSALYTHTLFDFDARLLAHLGPAIELGRSFVRPEWQRNFRALRLLWSGIAAVLDRHPDIRCLFGPVSISASYSLLGRVLMETALSTHHSDGELRALVKPRTPSAVSRLNPETRQVVAALSDPALLSRLVSRVERGSGLPVLLRHYLDLKGRFAGFNIDADFGNTLDGLVFVQVADIPPATRAKFSQLTRPEAVR